MPLFMMTVMDGDGVGQSAYVLLIDETKLFDKSPSDFQTVQLEYSHESINTAILDKDAAEIAAVQQELPNAKVVICLLHTMKALTQILDQSVKDTHVHEEVGGLLKTLAYSHSERSYDEAYAKLFSL